MMARGELPHLLLYGPPGVGKTSAIHALAADMKLGAGSILELNASDERGIQVVRKQIKDFVTTRPLGLSSIKSIKLVILDEADALTLPAQMALRRLMEQYCQGTRFCLLANSTHKLIPALLSRCTRFRFAPLPSEHVVKRVQEIAVLENLDLTHNGLQALIAVSKGDMRKILNVLQTCPSVVTEEAVYACTGLPPPRVVKEVYQFLRDPTLSLALRYTVVTKIIRESSVDVVNMVTLLHQEIMADMDKWTDKALAYILLQLATCEERGVTDSLLSIQLASLVSSFHLSLKY
jgi:replication factor C subunit 3/5